MPKSRFIYFIRKTLRPIFFPNNKFSFIEKYIPKQGNLFDVGCGNNSPQRIKQLFPDIYYVGLDIGIYNQSEDVNLWANEFILTSPDQFHVEIEKKKNTFDGVISTHNLEHCNYPDKVLIAMTEALNKGGFLYLSFPCEASVHFPTRKRTLNFYDDKTHKKVPSVKKVIEMLMSNGMKIIKLKKRNRPFFPFIIGLFFEPFGRLFNKQAPLGGTWALYGFETIIIAKKVKSMD